MDFARAPHPRAAQAFLKNFLGSLGVNTHIDQGYDATKYTTPLQYTGIRNIRDGERNLTSTLTLHQQTGILVNIGTNCGTTKISNTSNAANTITMRIAG